jgi:serine/threonine-protein kinase
MSTASQGLPALSGMKYLVETILATGDRDTVMRVGDQKQLGKTYALKVVKREGPADDIQLERARAHVEASAKLGHATCLKYYDYRPRKSWFRTTGGEVLMEYVPGQSLDALKDLSVAQGVLLAAQVAAALAHMNRRGVRHGDLTPGHVLLSKSGGVKVFGYGLSLLGEKAAGLGARLYAAPERTKGPKELTEKADLYSFGATFYHLLTGQPAHLGKKSIEGGRMPTPIAINPKIPTPINNLIVLCLSSDPEKRPEDFSVVAKQLDDYARSQKYSPEALKGVAQPKEA